MKNPCDNCIVKVNCTEVCPDKENYNTLLKDAMRHFSNINVRTNRRYSSEYRRFNGKHTRSQTDITRINWRRRSIGRGS